MATQSIHERTAALLAEMTLEEKVGQMYQVSDDDTSFPGGLAQAIRDGKIGSIINAKDPEAINTFQRYAVEESRLGIPILMARDVIHGFRTIFPLPLGQAASWNTELTKQAARIAAIEASSVGIRWTFAPSVDITRDPRWGRIAETFGEDPCLTSAMGVACVEGYQGESLSRPDSIAACAKHFVGYGAAEGGRDYNTVILPEVALRDVYLPPFKAAVNAGVATFMCSFNEVNGVPSSANTFVFREILKNDWAFNGFVVSDWESITEMIRHGYSADALQAASQAIGAGIDMEMVSKSYLRHVEELLEKGRIRMEQIDDSVSRILAVKFQLGLFDRPYVDTATASPLLALSHLATARKAATESIVLLKNHDNTLPLKDTQKIAVIGPLADAPYEQLGTWTFDGKSSDTITPLQALKELIPPELLSYTPALEYSRDQSTEGFQAAVDATTKADIALLFVGEEAILSGEAHARADLTLPGAQAVLIDTLAALGKPVVLVVLAGRPLAIGSAIDKAQAVLYAWHPGTMGGPALVDLLYGKANPSAKLPVTFPKTSGQIPIYHSHKNTGRPATPELHARMDEIPVGTHQVALPNTSYYLDAGFEPLYPFGFGLSYTQFVYSNLRLDRTAIGMEDTLIISVDIANAGDRKGQEVVQLYLRDLVGSLTRPVKELKGFNKITLDPGEKKTVIFKLTASDLAFHRHDLTFGVEPGEFKVFVGGNSVDVLEAEFVLK